MPNRFAVQHSQSRIFDERSRRGIESAVRGIIEREEGVLTSITSASTRAVGDAIQSVAIVRFEWRLT